MFPIFLVRNLGLCWGGDVPKVQQLYMAEWGSARAREPTWQGAALGSLCTARGQHSRIVRMAQAALLTLPPYLGTQGLSGAWHKAWWGPGIRSPQ